MNAENTKARLLEDLNDTVQQVVDVFQHLTASDILVYDQWTAKDILKHILFWHESFARNVEELAKDRKPPVLKGTYQALNLLAAEMYAGRSASELTARLSAAQRTIHTHILDPKLDVIPYKVGSRSYTPDEHLAIVLEHVRVHLKDIRKAIRKPD